MSSPYSKDLLLGLYSSMVRIRKFEHKAAEAFQQGLCPSRVHLCSGQEGSVAGAVGALDKWDWLTSTHRAIGHSLAKGAPARALLAELMGKATGCCCGKGGGMHLADPEAGLLGANGIVGAGLPLANGSALAAKLRKNGEVTLCFFGDGATNNGVFHESLNIASVWNLPVVYLCENNGYGISTAIEKVTRTPDIVARAKSYAITGLSVNSDNVLDVYATVSQAVAEARAGRGPVLVECKTWRQAGHYYGDPGEYSPAYLATAAEKDPIARYTVYLLENGPQGIGQADLDAVVKAAEDEMNDAWRFALESPFPGPSGLTSDVYAADNDRSVAR
ncbi:MAG: thiamine pyrophosphate-dependent dehydrogenase E1 component subunit alpha [Deltaproteobacteria bacterium]|jgi:pyruvate dehydrogenase E1 component alpha subunit|nr:thiamine pyrophosphate-dependent dehydrogenase E1 component subunit alpha [Deltaproteobacteria bacterium]